MLPQPLSFHHSPQTSGNVTRHCIRPSLPKFGQCRSRKHRGNPKAGCLGLSIARQVSSLGPARHLLAAIVANARIVKEPNTSRLQPSPVQPVELVETCHELVQ